MNKLGLFEKKITKIIAGVMLAFFLLYLGVKFYFKAFHGFAWDYAVNWTAALALREGLSLYDHAALQQLAISHIDSGANRLFSGRFTSFVGLPTTAIFHLPFSYMPYEVSALCYRISALFAMVTTILLTGLALPKPLRLRAWLVGVLCLLSWHAFSFSLQLGQVDAWVMLSLAAAVFAVNRAWWKRAGIAIGIAVLLKISPGWLLLYCLLKRQWSIVWAASICIAVGLLLSCLPQHGADLWRFFTLVLPSLGDSPLHVQNQALAAFLARLVAQDAQLLSFAVGIGWWKFAGVAIVFMLLGLLHRKTANLTVLPADLAVVILLALLAGPLTWDHYLAWAIIPVMLLSVRIPVGRLLWLLFLLLPLVFPVPYLKADVIAEHWWWRLLTGVQTIAVLALALWAIKIGKVDRH
jgi:hypothetical protein